MARSTVANTIERIRRQLDSSIRHETNQLGVNLDATETTVTLEHDFVPSLRAGTILSVGRELMRVLSINDSAKECVVIRGWQDSDGETHLAGDEVLISPRFTRLDIYEAIIDEITSWSPQLFTVTDYEWAVTDQMESVELPTELTNAIGVVALRRQWTDESDSTAWPELPFRLMRGAVGGWAAAVDSGLLIRLLPSNGYLRNGNVHALVSVPFDVTTNPLLETEDLVVDYGLEPSMLEVVELGVKMRILADAEVGRSSRQNQDEPRIADEVSQGASLTVAQTIRQNYQRRFGDEVRKLQRKYKPRAW